MQYISISLADHGLPRLVLILHASGDFDCLEEISTGQQANALVEAASYVSCSGRTCVAFNPTGHGVWLLELYGGVDYYGKYRHVGMPALCFFSAPLENSVQLYPVIVSTFVQIMSYTTRTIKLFQWSLNKSEKVVPDDPW